MRFGAAKPRKNLFIQQQKIHLEQKMTHEKALLHMSALESQIVTFLADHGRLGILEFQMLTGANRNTLKKYLSDLVSSGKILKLGKGRATWYTLP